MIITFSVGSKCAVMLPREFLNPQITPAKGMIVNRLVDSRSLVLVEEVWQFKGLNTGPITEMCTTFGTIKSDNWGWREIPELVETGEYLMLPAEPHNLMEPSLTTLEAMIKKSVFDFKSIHGFV